MDHVDQAGFPGAVRAEKRDPVALPDELPAGPEQQDAVRRTHLGVVQRHQRFGLRTVSGQPDGAGRVFAMGGLRGLLQPFRTLFQLLRLDDQKVAARIDADIVELGRLLAQLTGGFHVPLVAMRVRGVGRVERRPGARIGQAENLRPLRPQKERAVGHGVEEGPVVTDEDKSSGARQAVQPRLDRRNRAEVEMVGRFVEQKHIRLLRPGSREQRESSPPAAERPQFELAQCFRRLDRLQH